MMMDLPLELRVRVLEWLTASREYTDLAEPKGVAMTQLTCRSLVSAAKQAGRAHVERLFRCDVPSNWIHVLCGRRYLPWTDLGIGTGRLIGEFYWLDVYEWRRLEDDDRVVFASVPLERRRENGCDVFEARAGFLPAGEQYAEEPVGTFPSCRPKLRRAAPDGSSFGLALADVVVQIKVACHDGIRLLYEWSWPRELEHIPDLWPPTHPVFRRLVNHDNPGFLAGTGWVEDRRTGVDCHGCDCADDVLFGIRLCHPHARNKVAQLSVYFQVPVALWSHVTRVPTVDNNERPATLPTTSKTTLKIELLSAIKFRGLSHAARRRRRRRGKNAIVTPRKGSKLARFLDKNRPTELAFRTPTPQKPRQ